jgi:FAD:protein FMN transferase
MGCSDRMGTAAASWSAAPLLVAVLLPQPCLRAEAPVDLVHRQGYAMGTMVDVLVRHERRDLAGKAADAALAEILRLERVLSHYRADSDLSALLRSAGRGFVRTHPDLYDVIRRSLAVSARSSGAFDITIRPLLRLRAAARDEGRLPSAGEIERARRCVGYGKVDARAPDRVRLLADCVEIDLGGIGKGYAVDRAIAVLRSAGVRHALVNAGGSSIAAIGHPAGRRGWAVAAAGDERSAILLSDGALATSQHGVAPGRSGPAEGIVDPRTGAAPAYTGSVTVTAPDAALCDALSTALILLPRDAGVRLVREFAFAGVSAMWHSADGRLDAVSGPRPLLAERRQ